MIALAVIALGCLALLLSALGAGPAWLDGAGAVAVVAAYSWLLALRTGGRPVVFGLLSLLVGVAVLVLDQPVLRSGAAVMTAVVSAVLAVLITMPAVRFLRAVGETLLAMVVATIGGFAAVGFRPKLDQERFGYVVLALALVLALILVHRLGAGLHGLGRRGLVLIVVGSLVLALSLAYGELLSRYGTPGLLQGFIDSHRWVDDALRGSPYPAVALLGIPALVWGTHQRARRRQGWWACAFGVTATVRPAAAFVAEEDAFVHALVSLGLSVLLGAVLGWLLIRLDLVLSGPKGRRSVRAEQAHALRPEPARTLPLL